MGRKLLTFKVADISICLFALLSIEIILGGGGRVFAYGGLTLRYILFFTTICFFIFRINRLEIKKEELTLFYLFWTTYISIGLFSAITHQIPIHRILFDLQPLFYFMVFIWILWDNSLAEEKVISQFTKLVKIGSLILAFFYIAIYFAFKLEVLNYQLFYVLLSESTEIFFREGGAFFYKGFFFMGIGALLFFMEKKYLHSLFLLFAIVLTETRGLILACLACMGLFFLEQKTLKTKFFLFLLAPIVFLILEQLVLYTLGMRQGAGDSSTNTRLDDINFIFNNMEAIDYPLGKGFGASLNDRERIEVIFAEIFYKTGFVGLLGSFLFFAYACIKRFLKNQDPYNLFYIVLFMYLVSFTNPFLFTPMGIFTLAVCIIGMRKSEV